MTSVRSMVAVAATLILAVGCADAVQPLAPAIEAPSFNKSANDGEIQYTVKYESAVYDPAAKATTFTYTVTSGVKPAISHWMLLYSATTTPKDAKSNDPLFNAGLDGSTSGKDGAAPQHYGLKFDTGYDGGETRTVTLTLPGAWTVGNVQILVKAADGYVKGATTGPVAVATAEVPTYTVSGTVYFDVNGNSARDGDEPGLNGVQVSLSGGTSVTTDGNGVYTFSKVAAGQYTISASAAKGLNAATAPRTVQVGGDVADVNFRNTLELAGFCGQTANGYTIGYWKNNVEKNLQNKKGTQVSLTTLRGYQEALSGFALAPLNHTTLEQSLLVLSANGSNATAQLLKQLQASEFNYASGAYLNGNKEATGFFLYYGEYLAKNSTNAAELLAAKDWFDAYNNTHGGALTGAVCGS